MADPQLHIRIPKELREALAAEAQRQGVSLNNYVVAVLAGSVGWRKERSNGS